MRRFLASVLEILEISAIAVGSVFIIRTFLVQPFLVSGASMMPSFANGDYLLIDELTYRFRQPQRGEVVVFRYPNDESVYFIKRIVGLPNETVIIKDGKVIIRNQENPEGLVLKETYLSPGTFTAGNIEFKLKDDEYFVLGDNRSFSFDSRGWGVLKGKEIVGLVRLRLWPLYNFQAFAAPQY